MKFSPRTLWLLIALLAASNAATGLGVFYLLGRIDRLHSEVFDPDLADLGELREIARQSTNLQRAVLNLLLAAEPGEREAMRQRFLKVFEANRRSLDRLHQMDFEAVDFSQERELGRVGESYLGCARRVYDLVDANRGQEAQLIRATELRSQFEAYQAAQAGVAGCISDHAVTNSTKLTKAVTGVRSLLLAAAGLPLALLATLGLAFVIFLGLLFRIILRLRSET